MTDKSIILARTGIDVDNIEQGSEAWKRLRLGVITASNAINVIASGRGGNGWGEKKKTYLLTLIAEICTGQSPDITAKPLEWGKDHEDDARYAFEFVTGLEVVEVPFFYKDESLRCGASPDGICSDGAGLELKCPFNTATYLDFRLNGNIKPEYVAQCQFSMWVTGRERWYFANYDPRMSFENVHHIVFERDESFMKQFDEQVPEFIEAMDAALVDLGFQFGDQWGNRA
ncbi:lambda exonuclease family protein [Limnobaculum xujianqingii]|uniref:lambda exonuclease family protein n=1 Tax=Limnobaculum xujianqingii TaxID=2738837 RepID=UPI00112E2F4C|nr:lambda exonuclease family protein [Limnobaculum xujianqingii]